MPFKPRITSELFPTSLVGMRWAEGDVVHEVMKFWDDDFPEITLRCGRSPSDVPTMGVPAELPSVTCLLCLQAALDDETDDIPW